MPGLMDILSSQLSGGKLTELSKALGADEKTTGNAADTAMTTLVGALARNTSDTGAAESLHGALARDHDGSILDNFSALIGGSEERSGQGILRHVLGSKQPRVEHALGQTTGMDSGQVTKLLGMVAPMVMGALGKMQRQEKLDPASVAGLLGEQSRSIERDSPQAGSLVGKLLDTDGDGDVDVGDLAKHAKGLFGKFF